MAHLTRRLLEKANRFLLELHSAVELDALRTLIPVGLARLIASERVSFNEFDTDRRRRLA